MGITWLTTMWYLSRACLLKLWWRKLWKLLFSFHLIRESTCNFYVEQAHEAIGQLISLLQYRSEKWLGNMRGLKKLMVLQDLVMWTHPLKKFFRITEWSVPKIRTIIGFFFSLNQDKGFFLCLGFIACLLDRYRNVTKIWHVVHVFLSLLRRTSNLNT